MSTFNGPFSGVNTAILLDRYIKAYEKACDNIAEIRKEIEEIKASSGSNENKYYVNDTGDNGIYHDKEFTEPVTYEEFNPTNVVLQTTAGLLMRPFAWKDAVTLAGGRLAHFYIAHNCESHMLSHFEMTV